MGIRPSALIAAFSSGVIHNINQRVLIQIGNGQENPVAAPPLSYGVCQATENRVSSFSSF